MTSSVRDNVDRPPVSTPFRDRDCEVHTVVGNMSKVDGRRLFLLIGIPEMGKSMFLDALPEKLLSHGVVSHRIVRIDASKLTAEQQCDSVLLLGMLFEVPSWTGDDVGRQLADQLSELESPTLVMLDNAEALPPQATVNLRAQLCALVRELRARSRDGQLTFVATSSVDLPELSGLIPGPPFQKIVLKQFEMDVVQQALELDCMEAGVGASKEVLLAAGATMYADTEGLPSLLSGSLERLKSNEFRELQELEEVSLFADVAQPYLQHTLLSADVLLPPALRSFKGYEGAVRDRIGEAFLQLVLETSVFRLVTKTHLLHLASRKQELKDALSLIEAIGDPYDLFGSLALVEPRNELWHAPYAAIRRLCFRFRHLSLAQQVAAHAEAQAVYDNWDEGVSHFDLTQFLVERLWHQAEIVRLDSPPNGRQRVQSFLDELEHLMAGNRRSAFQKRVLDDQELQTTLEVISPGLSADFMAWLGP